MRILVVSNFFPPLQYGGYEIGCEQISQSLAKNHEVVVLTSELDGQSSANQREYGSLHVVRGLKNDFENRIAEIKNPLSRFWSALHLEKSNQRTFRSLLSAIQPDVVYFWNLARVSHCLPSLVNKNEAKSCCFVFDHSWGLGDTTPWARFRKAARTNKIKSIVASFASTLFSIEGKSNDTVDLAQFPTSYLRDFSAQNGFSSRRIQDVGWGVDLEDFIDSGRSIRKCSKILFVGQVAAHKGTHVLVDAFCRLASRFSDIELTIAGRAFDESYLNRLRAEISDQRLENRVHFCGFVKREQLPDLYQQNDILVFPSIWEEPMGIVPMEAMASGLVVVSSGRGGSSEIIEDEVDGLLFDVNDEQSLGSKLAYLLTNSELQDRLSRNAVSKAKRCFDFKSLATRIESQIEALSVESIE